MSTADYFEQPERIGRPLLGSIAFHGLLVGAMLATGWVQNRDRITLGDPNPPPLFIEKAIYYSPKLRSAMLRNSMAKSSMRAPMSRMTWPK